MRAGTGAALAVGWLVLVGGGALAWQNWPKADEELVTVHGVYDGSASQCPRDKPIRIEVHNGSRRTIKSVHLDIKVHERGNSVDLGNFPAFMEATYVVDPGDRSTVCYQMMTRGSVSDPVVAVSKRYTDFFGEHEVVPR